MSIPILHHPAYVAQGLPPGHRFPMQKFDRLADVLVEDGVISREDFITPDPAPREWLTLAHDPTYVDAVLTSTLDPKSARRIGFPIVESVAARSVAAVGGTIAAAHLALQHGAACNTAGGSHHADRAGGAGFCVFNDVAVAAHVLLSEGLIDAALVIDLDVHQGDGTARIFADTPEVRTISVHCEKNFPHRKATSDRDVGLDVGVGDADYLDVASDLIDTELAARRFDIVFYNAGVDPHFEDRLGLLSLTDQGLARRDKTILEACARRDIPVVGVLGGGYDDDVTRLARRHALLHKAAAQTHAAGADRRTS